MKNRLYRLAWKALPKLPQPLILAGTNLVADVAVLFPGASVKQMADNYESLTGRKPSRRQLRRGVRSYFRSVAQQFTLPAWSPSLLRKSCVWDGADEAVKLLDDGPLVLALTHSGNWDLAGAWFTQSHAPIVTVAEKLEPEDLFQQFVAFREQLGMEIIGVGPGEKVFEELVEKVDGRSVLVPLLADRDISGHGVEVQLGNSKALVAAGPAALALRLGRPLIAGHISYEKHGGRWRIRAHFSDPIEMPELEPGETKVEALTRAWVEELGPTMAKNVEDWHMMQKVFVKDLDPARLARARQRAGVED